MGLGWSGSRLRDVLIKQASNLIEDTMRALLTTSALVMAFAVPTLASAEELKFSAGATLASTYVSDGVDINDGPVLQPWIEGTYGAFYFGAWMSTLDKEMNAGDSFETDLYFGFRAEQGPVSYDIGYYRYFYNESGNCCGEIIASLGYAATEQLNFGLSVSYDPSSDNEEDAVGIEGEVEYAFNDKMALFASYGTETKGGHDYWSIGGSYAINDNFGLSLSWNDTNIKDDPFADGKAVLALDYSFDWR